MIYLITGVPGAHKTCYAVATLLRKLAAQKLVHEGVEIERRVVVDGIKELLIPHEMMAPGKVVKDKNGIVSMEAGEGQGVWNWPEWVKPGDIVVVDECQKWWRPRGMGVKPTHEVTEMEEHRHYGIDMVFITQSPMLIDQNVRRMVGSHSHMRRLFGTKQVMRYEWDGCQSDTSRLAGATRSLWSPPAGAYGLYRSAEIHTKQIHKIPLWLAIPVVAAVAGLFAVPNAAAIFMSKEKGMNLKPAVAASAPASAPAATPRGDFPALSPSPLLPASGPNFSVFGSATAKKSRLMGCVSMASRCECFGEDGSLQEMPAGACQDASERVSALPLASGSSGSRAAPKGHECDWVQVGGKLEAVCGATPPSPPIQQTSPEGDINGGATLAQPKDPGDGPLPVPGRRAQAGSARVPGARSAP